MPKHASAADKNPECTDNGDGRCSKSGGIKALSLCSTHWQRRYKAGTLPKSTQRMVSADGWAAFKVNVEALGGVVLEPEWLGSHERHHVRCSEGHDCYPRPGDVRQGHGICNTCAYANYVNARSAPAEAAFKAKLAELGATLLDPEWRGNNARYHIRCAAGHDCYPMPNGVQQGEGICSKCGRANRINPKSAPAETAFRARLAELGATLLEPMWLGAAKPHHVRCACGRDSYPRPADVRNGAGICVTCAGKDPATAEANFRARLAALGAELLEPYINSQAPHHVRCASGHDCYPTPGNVSQGHGICPACAGRVWDVFYVVTGPKGLKFGISSGDPRPRLANHRHDGYYGAGDPDRLWNRLPDGVARQTENLVLASLTNLGYKPNWRREYFDIELLGVVLGVVDRELAPYTPLIGPGADLGAVA